MSKGRAGEAVLKLFALCIAGCLFIFSNINSSFCQEDFVYDSKGKRNPFIPLVTSDGRFLKLDKEETYGDLAVEGVIYQGEGRSYALVDGVVVGIGDTIKGYQVLKIEKNKVTFIKEGQVKVIEINKEGE